MYSAINSSKYSYLQALSIKLNLFAFPVYQNEFHKTVVRMLQQQIKVLRRKNTRFDLKKVYDS